MKRTIFRLGVKVLKYLVAGFLGYLSNLVI